MIIAAIALAQWLVVAIVHLFKPNPRPLMISSALFALGWLTAFATPSHAKVVQASAVSTVHGSCATVEPGMTSDELAAKVGTPDEKRPNEEARGPGAVIWIYRDSRCAVHLFDNKVEAVD
jgi:hypothetical protein